MDNFLPYYTDDGSVGLFSNEFNDIYHSAYGALTEAYEKFVLPLNLRDNKQSKINVLDICYGLGYNTKSFLNFIIKNNLFINNNLSQVNIDCLEINPQLIKLSPFIKTNQSKYDIFMSKMFPKYIHKSLSKINYEKIKKYTKSISIQNNNFKISDVVNELIILKLLDKYGDDFPDKLEILQNKNLKPFFVPSMMNFIKFHKNYRLNYTSGALNRLNLHNIYYLYISKRYKYNILTELTKKISMNFYDTDARISISNSKEIYDYIFLDAFTTNKCPSLWSIDFFKLLYEKIHEDGMLLTYSTSAIVRNTMLSTGFYVGKIIDKNNKPLGTICSKNKNKIKIKLNNFECGLLKTKAGIPYKDSSLNLSNSDILNNRLTDVQNSRLVSSSKYVKNFKGVKNEI